MKHLKLISMFILGGLVLAGCAVKSPTTAMLEHKEKKVNQTIVEIPKWYKKLPKDKVRLVENPKKFMKDYVETVLSKKTKNKDNEEHFQILRKISKKPKSSQRQLAKELGISLGKLNYCLKELRVKGLIKIENFKKNPNKLNYLYVLTPQGISSKTKMTINFMKRKMREYDELKLEIYNQQKKKNIRNNIR